jgi:hypothetical protein
MRTLPDRRYLARTESLRVTGLRPPELRDGAFMLVQTKANCKVLKALITS